MLLTVLFSVLVTMAHNGTRNYEVCLKENFQHKACYEAKQLYKAGKYGCKIQGKEFNGNSTCQ